MKKIIVPIDFSEISFSGLDLAMLFAEKTQSKIEMIHVVELQNFNTYSPQNKNEAIAFARERFEKIKREYESRSKSAIEITYLVKEGEVYKEITEQAEANKNSVIVMSTNGHTGLKNLIMGSNAYHIVNNSKNEVITIRGNTIPSDIQKIVMPIDITRETRQKVPYTIYMAKLFNSEVHVVSMNTSEYEDLENKLELYQNQSVQMIKKAGIKSYAETFDTDNIADAAIHHAASIGADMISIMTEQEKHLKNLVMGNYTKQIINKSPLPVLLSPMKDTSIVVDSFKTEGIEY